MRLSAFFSPPPDSSHGAISSGNASAVSIAGAYSAQQGLPPPPPLICSSLCLVSCTFLSSAYRLFLAFLDDEIRENGEAINAIDAEIKKVEQGITDDQNKADDLTKQMIAITMKSPELSESSKLGFSLLKDDKATCYTHKAALEQDKVRLRRERDRLRQEKNRLREEKLELLRRAPSAVAPVAPSGAAWIHSPFLTPFVSWLFSFLT